MSSNVFTYGSLAIPQVMELVTQSEFQHEVSTLLGYERFLLRERTYPGIIENRGERTIGRVYFAVSDEALRRLDYFEDDCYTGEIVEPILDNGSTLQAFAYVVPSDQRRLLTNKPWDEKSFVAEKLDSYLLQAQRWMKDYSADSSTNAHENRR